MNRFANGSSPTGEYSQRIEYDAGYRDGYRAARERANAELAVFREQVEQILKASAAAMATKPLTVKVSVERATQLIEEMKREGK